MNTVRQNPAQALRQIELLLSQNKAQAALQAARALSSAQPDNAQAHVLLGHALRQTGDNEAALVAARRASELQPGDPAAGILEADLLQTQGMRVACVELLHRLASLGGPVAPRLLQDVAQRFAMLGLHAEAEQCHARALALQPDDPQYLYNHATSLIALGQLEAAEAALDRVIALRPEDSDAWYNRATLRKQSVASNHVAAIEARLRKTPPVAAAGVALGYALAKELEDLGEHARSFAALKQAADGRRRLLRYRVEDDLDTMQRIASAFDADFFQHEHPGHADARPLFIVGLPRSGTTLVDRILSSHSQILSRGETSDLVMALMKTAGPASNKAELVQRSSRLDFAALGRQYTEQLAADKHARQIDKTPINFLYLGLIAAALPNARVIHVRRNPMDVCYAMYKTLFRMAYPFSYDLQDLARYWLGYQQLMAHWRGLFPPHRLFEIDYETLVADQQNQSRALIDFVGLPWEDRCLHFERNAQPSLTASAAQVRQPIYRSSLQLWRRYEQQLAPLRARLEAAGVLINEPATGAPHE